MKNIPTYQFCGSRMQAYYGRHGSEPETPCKIHRYLDYLDDGILGYSFSDEGHVCVFLRHVADDRRVYKWLSDPEEARFKAFFARHQKAIEETPCHIIVHTGAEASYGCDGFWLSEDRRLCDLMEWEDE